MENLKRRAKELIESGAVKLVIGYEEGVGNKPRPVFIDNSIHVSKLIFDSRCVQNLAVYVTKPEVRMKGKLALVASIPTLRSLLQLASENQITNNNLVVFTITPELTFMEFDNLNEIETFLHHYQLKIEERDREILQKIDSMSVEERWKFWIKTLEPCFKCYACRAACPLCYCTQCTVEYNRPQWIPVPSHQLGNLEWHIMRAMHMAGRCTDCEACARACPLGIPLNLFTKKIRQEMVKDFGDFSPSLSTGNMMSTFKPDDKENFIK